MQEDDLADLIQQLWNIEQRRIKMPRASSRDVAPWDGTGASTFDILDSGVSAASLRTRKVNVGLYGRNRVGKTTLACQGEGPIALIAVDPSPTGGARSVTRKEVTVFQVASKPLIGRDGNPEPYKGSEKILMIVEAIKARFDAGHKPFKKIVLDGVSSWNDIILSEILGVEQVKVAELLGTPAVLDGQYRQRSEKLSLYLKPILDLPCDVWILAQEKDHNPPKSEPDKKGRQRPLQGKLLREVHPALQDGSFFSFALGETQALNLYNACDFVLQLYEEDEILEEKLPDVQLENGEVMPGQIQQVVTGRRCKRLRCTYDGRHAAGVRDDYRNIPEYIEAPDPESRYAAFLEVVQGRRTKWGKYSSESEE